MPTVQIIPQSGTFGTPRKASNRGSNRAVFSTEKLMVHQSGTRIRREPLTAHWPMSVTEANRRRALALWLITSTDRDSGRSVWFGVECDKNAMSATGTPNDAVYCNNCGTANPPRSAVCCNCGHVHARVVEVRDAPTPAIVTIEQWFWIGLRITCGVALCVEGVLPASGSTLNATLLGSIIGSLAIPVLLAALLGNGNWARSSRWFLGAALVLSVTPYLSAIVRRIHFR